jgi:hypothetical protein
MRRAALWQLAACVLISTTGCSVQGKWQLETVEPSAARRDFQYEVLTLEKDGSFYAEAREIAKDTRTTSGTYRYEDGVLALREHDGEERTYRAECPSAKRLKLKDTWKDRELVATFARVE